MRTVKWCLSFGVVLAGVVVGYCRPCHECDLEPLSPKMASFDSECCEEGDCCRQPVIGTEHCIDLGKDELLKRIDPPTREERNAMQAAEKEASARLR